MKRLDLLTPVAIALAAGATAFYLRRGTVPGGLSYYLLAAGVLLLVHLALRAPDIARAIGARRVQQGGNTFVLSVAVLAILVAVNWLAFRHDHRWDLTKTKRYSLSDQTRKIVAGLKDDIKITYFQRKLDMEAGRDRLNVYESLSPQHHIKAEFVDPFANPDKAAAYDARGPWPTIVIERGTRRERITNDTEADLTNTLIKITRDTTKSICFEEGEGERDIDDLGEGGLGNLKTALTKASYQVQKVALVREGKIPATCNVFVVAGPQKDLLPSVIDALRAYVKGAGKLLVMEEPERQTAFTNLTALLKEWNIDAGQNIILDVSPFRLQGTGPLTAVAGATGEYPYHDITREFRVATVFHTARTMRAGTAPIEGVTAQNLVETSPASWGETDLTLKDPLRNPKPDPANAKGPLPVAAVATIHVAVPAGEQHAIPPEGRVVAFGDVDFASNQIVGMLGNQDLLLNTIAWLAQDSDMISIRPTEPERSRLFLSQGQQWVLIGSLLVIPVACIMAGITGWWRRRRG